MQRERVADDIYVFTSDLYAQVTAVVVVTSEGAVVIDTLLYPEESRLIKRFIESRLSMSVRYVINTHFHADHSTGTCFFVGARVVAHSRCRELLDTRGRESLAHTQANTGEFRDVRLVLPDMVFDGGPLNLYVGNKTFQLSHSPGHSPDSIVCLVKEDRVLCAADTLMPVPYFVDGNFDAFVTSLEALRNGNFDNVVQGHGEVILRGEVEEKIESDLEYLQALRKAVDRALSGTNPEKSLEAIDIESCGKSRILLNGTVQLLHRQNVLTLASQRRRELVQY